MPAKKTGSVKSGTRGRFVSKTAGPDRGGKRSVSAEKCIEALQIVGPMPGDLKKKLNIPNELFAKTGIPSFTSSPDEEMAGLMEALLTGMPLPANLPDFGIEINARGSTTYCILVDKKRRVIVMNDIMGAYDESGTWEFFKMGLDEALSVSESLQKDGNEFVFVVNKELSNSIME